MAEGTGFDLNTGHGSRLSRPPSETRRFGLSSSGIFRVNLKMVATGVKNSARKFAAFGGASACQSMLERTSVVRSWTGACRARMKSLGLGLAILLLAPGVCSSGVLTESDFKKVEDIKPLFQNLMGDLVQTSKRSGHFQRRCGLRKSTIRELLQISDELSSYEYLITIEKEMTDFGDNNPMRGIVKFAVEKIQHHSGQRTKATGAVVGSVYALSLVLWQNAASVAIHRHHDQYPQFHSGASLACFDRGARPKGACRS